MSDSQSLGTKNKTSTIANSLIFKFGNLGLIALEPMLVHRRDMPFIDYLIFPRPIPESKIPAAHLWVEGRECPIFCVKTDLENFQKSGFGAHKFNLVDGYREISVEGGSITFYPAAQEKNLGIKGLVLELFEAWGLRPTKAFHVKLKARNSPPILILANPIIEDLDSRILCEEKPAKIVALPGFPERDWKRIERLFGQQIMLYHEALEALTRDPRALSPKEETIEASAQ